MCYQPRAEVQEKVQEKMARMTNKLTNIKVRTAPPGRYADGGNLYLDVAEGGSRSWLFLWKRDGRTFSAGFGGYPLISLSRARTKAAEARASATVTSLTGLLLWLFGRRLSTD